MLLTRHKARVSALLPCHWLLHACATFVSIRQHTSAYVSIRQHTSAYVSIRQHTSAYVKGAGVSHCTLPLILACVCENRSRTPLPRLCTAEKGHLKKKWIKNNKWKQKKRKRNKKEGGKKRWSFAYIARDHLIARWKKESKNKWRESGTGVLKKTQ